MPKYKPENIIVLEHCIFDLDEVASRGLCNAHYLKALRLIQEGKTTWEELELRNLSIPTKVVQRLKPRPFERFKGRNIGYVDELTRKGSTERDEDSKTPRKSRIPDGATSLDQIQ